VEAWAGVGAGQGVSHSPTVQQQGREQSRLASHRWHAKHHGTPTCSIHPCPSHILHAGSFAVAIPAEAGSGAVLQTTAHARGHPPRMLPGCRSAWIRLSTSIMCSMVRAPSRASSELWGAPAPLQCRHRWSRGGRDGWQAGTVWWSVSRRSWRCCQAAGHSQADSQQTAGQSGDAQSPRSRSARQLAPPR
jgi:hypothetical protein